MMIQKRIFFILFFLIPSESFSQASSRFMMRKTTQALMASPPVKKTVKEMTIKLQNETIGDKKEVLILLAPFFTSEFKYKIKPLHTTLYINHRNQEAGMRYSYEF